MRTGVKWTLGCSGAALLLFGLLTLLFAILYFSYNPDGGQQVLCAIGSQSSCDALQQAADGHTFTLIALIASGICFLGTLLLGGIALLAVSV